MGVDKTPFFWERRGYHYYDYILLLCGSVSRLSVVVPTIFVLHRLKPERKHLHNTWNNKIILFCNHYSYYFFIFSLKYTTHTQQQQHIIHTHTTTDTKMQHEYNHPGRHRRLVSRFFFSFFLLCCCCIYFIFQEVFCFLHTQSRYPTPLTHHLLTSVTIITYIDYCKKKLEYI